MTQSRVVIAGAGGFIGGHLVKFYLAKKYHVVAVDVKPFQQWFQLFDAAENKQQDLQLKEACFDLLQRDDIVINLACNMGGMGFIENNKALCMASVLINTHLLLACKERAVSQYIYASSACIYPDYKQSDKSKVVYLKESDVYPAMPENGYGWEKLFSERMCLNFAEDFALNTKVFRAHNVYGPYGSYQGGREKAPAALCRKVITAQQSNLPVIDVWGDGKQIRSFTYIDDCVEGIHRIVTSDKIKQPINLGSDYAVTIEEILVIIETIAGVKLQRKYIPTAPQGVMSRCSDNSLIKELLSWAPSYPLAQGLKTTYDWIKAEMVK